MHRKPITHIYGYVYLTTNTVNYHKYIGCHVWGKPYIDPNYLGSGKVISQAIKKYGKQNFTVEILGWAEDREELNELERYWIAQYNAVNDPTFYNLQHGGQGAGSGSENPNYGKPLSESTKEKLRQANIGKSAGNNNYFYGKHMRGPEHPMFGRHHTEASKQKMREAQLGRQHSTVARQHMSASNKASKATADQRRQLHSDPQFRDKISQGLKESSKHQKALKILNASKRIAISQYTKQGEWVQDFESIKAAAAVGYSETGIQYCLKGKLKTSGGYVWKRKAM